MRGKLGKFSLDALVNLPPGLYWKSVLEISVAKAA